MKAVTLNSIVGVIRARRGYKTFLSNFINECEIVDAIPIPDGATNGDMLKAVFPDESTFNGGECLSFKKEWWDAPYKKEVKNE